MSPLARMSSKDRTDSTTTSTSGPTHSSEMSEAVRSKPAVQAFLAQRLQRRTISPGDEALRVFIWPPP